jgi:DNA polymerase-4
MEIRLANARCLTVKKMYQLSIHEMREIWGGITGERFWWLIRGETLDAQATERRTIGHSRVLAPQHRNYQDAWSISVQLLSKACMRLREEGFNCKELTFSMKFIANNPNEKYWKARAKFIETKDTSFLIKELEKLWKELLKSKSRNKILKVSVTLHNLVSEQKKQLSLFEDYKSNSLMKALDIVNKKYRSSTVYIAGAQNKDEIGKAPSGKAPIAFQHIPKLYE